MIFQLLAVNHDKVIGQGIQAVVQRVFSALVQFLRCKGDEDGSAAGLSLIHIWCNFREGGQYG